MQNIRFLAQSVKDNLEVFREFLFDHLKQDKLKKYLNQGTIISPFIYNKMRENQLNRTSKLLEDLVSQAELADKNREKAKNLLQNGRNELNSEKTKDWKAFATDILNKLGDIFPLNEQVTPDAA